VQAKSGPRDEVARAMINHVIGKYVVVYRYVYLQAMRVGSHSGRESMS